LSFGHSRITVSHRFAPHRAPFPLPTISPHAPQRSAPFPPLRSVLANTQPHTGSVAPSTLALYADISRYCPDAFPIPHESTNAQAGGKKLTALLGRDPVDRVIGVALCAYPAADSNGGGLSLDGLSVGVNVGDLNLDRGVVLGVDETVCQSVICSHLLRFRY
jgi:hypothetical protein